jgi:hypothetical protein
MQKSPNNANSNESKSAPGSQSVDLASPGVAKALAKRIATDIDEYCAKAYDDGPRRHLGASLIGHECSRYLWYVFRWCLHEKHDGRQQRLFNRGHREEARFIEWLEGIGFKVWFEDRSGPPDAEGNYPQFRISGVNGHFGGSLDGIGILPERYQINEPVLLEFKTNGTGAGFNKLVSDGMPVAKPQHFAQTSTYGHKGVQGTKFRFVVYLNINKNDDSIHIEVVELNHKLGAQMEAKAERIIMSPKPPARLSDNPTFRDCGWCAMKGICHENKAPERNCRSCANASPVENAEWFCSVHNAIIPREYIPQACPQYKAVTENV